MMSFASEGKGFRRHFADILVRNRSYIALAISFFAVAFFFSCRLIVSECPDEFARHLVSAFIFETGRLPTGLEPETRIPLWGFSYAVNPFLVQMLSAVFMRVASLFSDASGILIVAARFPSVLSGTLAVFTMCKVGERFSGEDRTIGFASGLLLALLPQFLFLSSYENNDAFAILCCLFVAYCWCTAWARGGWSTKLCIGLGVSIGLLALSYYNAYGFILCSIPVFFLFPMRGSEMGESISRRRGFFIVAACALAVAGWFFLRNMIVLDGDMFGLRTRSLLFDRYGSAQLKPPIRMTLQESGLSPLDAFVGTPSADYWWSLTLRSMVCITGYMAYALSDKLYIAYQILVVIGMLGFLVSLVSRDSKRPSAVIVFSLLACLVITFFLSMYYSYTTDLEPQGRYVMSSVVAIIPALACGFRCFDRATAWAWRRVRVKRASVHGAKRVAPLATAVVLIVYALLSAICIYRYFMPCIAGFPPAL